MEPRPESALAPALQGKAAPTSFVDGDAADMVLAYAMRGWPVLPLFAPTAEGGCDCGDPKCEHPGKHPRIAGGFCSATTATSVVRYWMRTWTTINWGISTGQKSGLVFLDVDGEAGFQSMRGLALPMTRVHLTGRGWQAAFQLPPGEDWSSATALLPGIDIKARGGYVVVPPSLHFSGQPYQVYLEAEPVLPPPWLRDLVRDRISVAQARLDMFPVGQRNDQLFRRGCGFARNRGMTFPRLLAWLIGANRNRCQPPLDKDEVDGIARNVWKIVNKARQQQQDGKQVSNGLP